MLLKFDYWWEFDFYLSASHYAYASPSEFVCLDGSPQDIPGSEDDRGDITYFTYTIAKCGALPCPPYRDGQVVSCVVCAA